MDLHEFQAKALLSRYGIPVPSGRLALTPAEAEAAARGIGGARFVVKAQVHAGGRGSSGGVRPAKGPGAVAREAQELIGRNLVTAQTPQEGLTVKKVYVEEAVNIARSLYAAVVIDGSAGRVALVGSSDGGEEIEERHRGGKSRLEQVLLSIGSGAPEGDFIGFAKRLGLEDAQADKGAALFQKLAQAFVELDASLIEINPLAITPAGDFVAAGVRIILDDNALFRHADLANLHEEDKQDSTELAAQRHQMNYLQMDGDIGVVVNGAGLALATLDSLRDSGGEPANFMDIRTTASSLDIARGFELLLAKPGLKAVLVNVHGGGMQRCDTIAEGIGIAIKRAGRVPPIVARFAGNNAEYARMLLGNYGIPFVPAPSIGEASEQAVSLARGGKA
jgi:succinyl-CoA synthetase beta subunit